ncbi:MAG: ribonuclease III [Lentisphaerae bacterium]|jgi:ribonuclease-3|nr:ribonuclease III [Lentisphaerota bacterium]
MADSSKKVIRKSPEELQADLGYVFRNRNLLVEALVHRSYRKETGTGVDNQRLEFLGDALLGFLFADRVYNLHAEKPEGALTVLRAAVVSGVSLANKARQLGVGGALLLGNGEDLSGGRNRESNLADAMESLMGAVYIDGGIEAASEVFDRLFGKDILALEDDPWMDNPKGQLQNIVQKLFQREPKYETLEETGPPHSRVFRVGVRVDDCLRAEGTGSSKQQAQCDAAAALLLKIERDKEEA